MNHTLNLANMPTQTIGMETLQNKAHLQLLSKINRLTSQIQLLIFIKLEFSKLQDQVIRNSQIKP